MAKTKTLSILSFEISQNPEEKTGYFMSVRGVSTHSAQIESWLWQIQNALAFSLSDGDILLACPTPFEKEHLLFCIVHAKNIVPPSGGRNYLLFQAVLASFEDLMRGDVNPMGLYYSDAWSSINKGTSPTFCKVPILEESKEGENDLARRLWGDDRVSAEFSASSFEDGVTAVQRAIAGIGWNQLAQASLAIGLPSMCQLPFQPLATVKVIAPVAPLPPIVPTTSNSYVRGEYYENQGQPGLRPLAVAEALVPYKRCVREIINEVGVPCEISPLWASRLWNQSQDVLTLTRAAEQNGTLHNHRERLADAHDLLSVDLKRSGVDGGVETAKELDRFWSALDQAYTRWTWRRMILNTLIGILVLFVLWGTYSVFFVRRGGDARPNLPTTSRTPKPSRR